jgi:radical SAM superfamily enzyme YgiQ (UPF0313 family)
MQVYLVNPSDMAFGVGVITPRWLFVLAAATPRRYGDPVIVDETIAPLDLAAVQPGDVVGIGIHTANALRGYEVGRLARERGARVVFGGIHATLYPDEPFERGGAHAIGKGDGDLIWSRILADCEAGTLDRIYEGGRVGAEEFLPARWDLLSSDHYMWASVQTVRGCPKHCSFCSVWRTDGQKPRQRNADAVVREIVELRRKGFRFIALADDNFYPVTLTDLRLAERQNNHAKLEELKAIRAERFELMEQLSELPADMIFFTQITMEAAEDFEFLDAMKKARIRGALVGVEAVTPEGLKSVFKDFNKSGDDLVTHLRSFREHGVFILGSFIFGLPTDTPSTFQATSEVAQKAGLTFAQFVTLQPFPGTIDFERWEKTSETAQQVVEDVPLSRYWLIPSHLRPKLLMAHPTMDGGEIRELTQSAWDHFYSFRFTWERARIVKRMRNRLAFMLISKLYRQMYANTGLATDSARKARANNWARWIAKTVRGLFHAKPMPGLQVPRASEARVGAFPIIP